LYPLYAATDGQQTGNNFVADNKQHVDCNRQHVALVQTRLNDFCAERGQVKQDERGMDMEL